MRTRHLGAAVLAAALAVSALTGCSSSAGTGAAPVPPPQGTSAAAATTAATPTTPGTGTSSSSSSSGTVTSAAGGGHLSPALLTLADLPSGFKSEPLTVRNLPSLIHGCSGLEELQATGIGDLAQAEWTRGALDAYIDEAVIQPPAGDTAAGLVEKTATALDACGSVQVVEEGLSVTLTATPLQLAKVGDAAHAWHTTGKYGPVSMAMNVVIVQAGNLVVLLAQTHVAGQTDDALTLRAAQAAAVRATAFQKGN